MLYVYTILLTTPLLIPIHGKHVCRPVILPTMWWWLSSWILALHIIKHWPLNFEHPCIVDKLKAMLLFCFLSTALTHPFWAICMTSKLCTLAVMLLIHGDSCHLCDVRSWLFNNTAIHSHVNNCSPLNCSISSIKLIAAYTWTSNFTFSTSFP